MKRITDVLLVLALSTALIPVAAVLAREDGPDDNSPEVEGKEKFDCEIRLTPTAEAPAGATAKVELESEMEDGIHEGKLEVEVEHMPAGTYGVRITTRSDGSEIDLGTFDVPAIQGGSNSQDDVGDDHGGGGHNGGDDSANDQSGDDDGMDDHGRDDDEDEFEIEFSLPDGILARDVASIAILNGEGATLFTGECSDLDSVMTSKFKANLAVAGGDASPDASGRAVLLSKSKHGKLRQKFLLVARFAPPDSTLMLRINGEDVMEVESNHKGKVKIRSLPDGISVSSILSFELVTVDGGTALAAHF